jgi:4-amino-4-deoxy-L-arabinose transferase-like glycosyltransferase
MDEATRERFKWRFYRLAVLLNLVILLVAIGFIALFKAPEGYAVPLAAALFLLAGILVVYFRGQYRLTRSWLEENQEITEGDEEERSG